MNGDIHRDNDPVTNEFNSELKNMFPADWKTQILDTKLSDVDGNITITLILSAHTEEDIAQWIEQFEDINQCSYSIRSTEKSSGRYVAFKQRLNCRHNTGYKRKRKFYDNASAKPTRNTDCPSNMQVTLRVVKNRYKGKNPINAPDPEMPCKIVLVITHNHPLGDAHSLRFRPVGNETKDTLLALYANGHTPASALQTLKADIIMKHEKSKSVLADRKYCPDYMYCFHLYKKVYRKTKTNEDHKKGKCTFDGLEKYLQDENDSSNSIYERVPDTSSPIPSEETSVAINSQYGENKGCFLEQGRHYIENIASMLSAALENSPEEICSTLCTMHNRLKKLESISEIASATSSFASNMVRKQTLR